MPISHDAKKDQFVVKGAFCSWGCMRAYNRDATPEHRSSVQSMYLALFRKRLDKDWKMKPCAPAPPRQLLKVFGGSMTIQEFRACSEQRKIYSVLPAKMVPLTQVVEEQRQSAKTRVAPKQDLQTAVDFNDVSSKNECLRLRRPKPLKSDKNVLERAMGINAFFGGGT